LVAEANYNANFQNQVNQDVESIKNFVINSENTIGTAADFNSQSLSSSLVSSMQTLNSLYLSQQLNVLYISSQQTLNSGVLLCSDNLSVENRLMSDILSSESGIGSELNLSAILTN
jgi:translation initiation factor 6 (eIF-6)